MKPSGAGPAVGAGIDRVVAKFIPHPVELITHQAFSLFPGDFHKWLCAPVLGRCTWPVIEPAFADHGRGDAGWAILNINNARADGRGVLVVFKAIELLNAAVADTCSVGAPMGAC